MQSVKRKQFFFEKLHDRWSGKPSPMAALGIYPFDEEKRGYARGSQEKAELQAQIVKEIARKRI